MIYQVSKRTAGKSSLFYKDFFSLHWNALHVYAGEFAASVSFGTLLFVKRGHLKDLSFFYFFSVFHLDLDSCARVVVEAFLVDVAA